MLPRHTRAPREISRGALVLKKWDSCGCQLISRSMDR